MSSSLTSIFQVNNIETMNTQLEQKKIISQKLQQLQVKRRQILSLPPEEALKNILNENQALPLVHSFPEDDFYFLIHDIGVEDSLELLSLASFRQWEYILDAEIWQKDQIDIHALTRWLNLMMKAEPTRLIKWAAEEKRDIIEYYLFKNIELVIREHDQDPSDFPKDFFTDDHFFYLRFRNSTFNSEDNKDIKKQRDEFLWEFIKRISAYDHLMYQNILLESCNIIPAEFEEQAFYLRNIRRAEKGFLPFDQASGIYQPLNLEQLKRKNIIRRKNSDPYLPIPMFVSGMLEKDNVFVYALESIDNSLDFENMQTEFAVLCNQVIAADRLIIKKKQELKYIVKKVCGYVSIGLEMLAEKNQLNKDQAFSFINQFTLSDIFQAGYGKALELKWNAQKWQKKSWFENFGFPLSFWGEEWLGVLGGLLIKKPLYFDNYKTGMLYREFYCLDDIKESEKVLQDIMIMDSLLSLITEYIPQNITQKNDNFLIWKNFILTLWLRHYLNIVEQKAFAVNFNEFRQFYDVLWDKNNLERKIANKMKQSFLDWFCLASGLDQYKLTQKAGKIFEQLFNEIESEYKLVSNENLDPKYIHLFLVA